MQPEQQENNIKMNYKSITKQSYTQPVALLQIALFTIPSFGSLTAPPCATAHYSLFTAFK